MLFPYATDAPIYHWPIATVGLMVINTVVLVMLLPVPNELVDPFILHWGDGLHPVQWITSLFLHVGLGHLLGNMLFLWGFGLVVEGKVGWWRFVIIYLVVGGLQCMLEQTVMLGASGGGSIGASAAIFGILAMALVWAPQNDMSCLLLILIKPIRFECPIVGLAGVCIALESLICIATSSFGGSGLGVGMSSAALHMMGAVIGFGMGVLMLKANWVDCENWDLFSVWAGTNTISEAERNESYFQGDEFKLKQKRKHEKAIHQIREIVSSGQPELAYRAHRKMTQDMENWHLDDSDFIQLIQLFHKQEKWSESIEAMVEYASGQRDHESQVRLKLAQVLVTRENRPGQGLKVMRKIVPQQLTDKQRTQFQRLLQEAKRRVADDPYEVVDDAW
jgi:membrane associated rhomboid family serine protease